MTHQSSTVISQASLTFYRKKRARETVWGGEIPTGNTFSKGSSITHLLLASLAWVHNNRLVTAARFRTISPKHVKSRYMLLQHISYPPFLMLRLQRLTKLLGNLQGNPRQRNPQRPLVVGEATTIISNSRTALFDFLERLPKKKMAKIRHCGSTTIRPKSLKCVLTDYRLADVFFT